MGAEFFRQATGLLLGDSEQVQGHDVALVVVQDQAQGVRPVVSGEDLCPDLGIPAEHAVDLGQVSVALAAHGVGQAALADLAVAAALFGDAVFIVLELQVAGVDQLRQGGGEVEILHAVVAEGQVGQGGEIHRGGHTGHEIEHQKLDVQFIVDEACFCHAIGRSFPPAAGAPAAFIIGNFRTKGK